MSDQIPCPTCGIVAASFEDIQNELARYTAELPEEPIYYKAQIGEIVERHDYDALRHACAALKAENNFLRGALDSAVRPDVHALLKAENERLRNALLDLRNALLDISKGAGEFDIDPFEHAKNCIHDMKAIARTSLTKEQSHDA